MPGRFKVSGTDYVSEWGGSAANDGTNPLTPYASPADINVALANRIVVLGTGVYRGIFPNVFRTYRGDGRAVVDFLGGGSTSTLAIQMENCIIRNGLPLRHLNPASGWIRNIYENCEFSGGTNTLLNSILKPKLSGTPVNVGTHFYSTSSIILASVTGASLGNVILGSFISKDCIIPWGAAQALGAGQFANNCFNGILSRNGINYELKQLFDGSPRPDANPAIADLSTIFAGVYTSGNFACVDPEFLDLESRIVKPTSPLLRRSQSGEFVGSVKPGKFVPITDPSFQVTFTRMNTSNPEAAIVSAGQNDGTVRMTGRISESLVSSRFFGVRSIMEYRKSAAAGSVENNNVPDAVKLLGLLPAEIDKPRRLTYLMRTSLDPNANQSSPDAIWDNNGATAGEYLLFEANTAPAHIGGPSGTRGNGDPRATGGTETPFNFRSVDIIFLLDNARV